MVQGRMEQLEAEVLGEGSICRAFTLGRRERAGFDGEGVGVMLEHLPPEPGALAGVRLDVVRLREAQVGDVGVGEDAGDVGGLHDHVGAVGVGEGVVVVEEAGAEVERERGERERGGDLGVDGVGQAAGALEAGPPASASAGVHGGAPASGAEGRGGETLDSRRGGVGDRIRIGIRIAAEGRI
jgi:hypothetical protein